MWSLRYIDEFLGEVSTINDSDEDFIRMLAILEPILRCFFFESFWLFRFQFFDFSCSKIWLLILSRCKLDYVSHWTDAFCSKIWDIYTEKSDSYMRCIISSFLPENVLFLRAFNESLQYKRMFFYVNGHWIKISRKICLKQRKKFQ